MINDYLRYKIDSPISIKKSDVLKELESRVFLENNNNKQCSDSLKDACEIIELLFRGDFSFKEYLKSMDSYMYYLQHVNDYSLKEREIANHRYKIFNNNSELLTDIFLYLEQLKTQYQGVYKGKFNLRLFQGDSLYFADFIHLGSWNGDDDNDMYRSYIVNKSEIVGFMLYNPTKKRNLPEKLYCFPDPSIKTFDRSNLNDTLFFEDFNEALEFVRKNRKDLAECFENYANQHFLNFFEGYKK
jgi:hypothetical protein